MSRGADAVRDAAEVFARSRVRGGYLDEAAERMAEESAGTWVRVDDGENVEDVRDREILNKAKRVKKQALQAEKSSMATMLRDRTARFDRGEIKRSLKTNKELLVREETEAAMKKAANQRRQRIRMFGMSCLLYRGISIDNIAMAAGLMLGAALTGGFGPRVDAEGLTRKERKAQRAQDMVERFDSMFSAIDGVTGGLGERRPRKVLDEFLIPRRDKAMAKAKRHVPLTAKDVAITYLGIVSDTLDRLSDRGCDDLAIRRDASEMVNNLYEVASGNKISADDINEMIKRMTGTLDGSNIDGLDTGGLWEFPLEAYRDMYAKRGCDRLPSESALMRAHSDYIKDTFSGGSGGVVQYSADCDKCLSAFNGFIAGVYDGNSVLDELGYNDVCCVLDKDLSDEEMLPSQVFGDLSSAQSQEHYRDMVFDYVMEQCEDMGEKFGSGRAYGMGYADWCDPKEGISSMLCEVGVDSQSARSLSPQGVDLREDLRSVRDSILRQLGEASDADDVKRFAELSRFGMAMYAYAMFDRSFPDDVRPLRFDDGFSRLDAAYDDLVVASDGHRATQTSQSVEAFSDDGFESCVVVAENVFCKGQGGHNASFSYTYRANSAGSNTLVRTHGEEALVDGDRMRGAMDAVRRQGISMGVALGRNLDDADPRSRRAATFKDDGDVFASMSCGVHTLLRLYDTAVARDVACGGTSHVDMVRNSKLWGTLVDDGRSDDDVIADLRSADEACRRIVDYVCDHPGKSRDLASVANACGLSSMDVNLVRHLGEAASQGTANSSDWPLIPSNANYGSPLIFEGVYADAFVRAGAQPGVWMGKGAEYSFDLRDFNYDALSNMEEHDRNLHGKVGVNWDEHYVARYDERQRDDDGPEMSV